MNYFPSPTIPNIAYGIDYPQYLSGNVATFGSIALGKTPATYERAIVRLKSKISNLKKKRRLVKSKKRKNFINTKILVNQKKLKKLQGYLAIKLKNKKKRAKGKKVDEPVFEDEELLLTEAELPDEDEMIYSDEIVDEAVDSPNYLPFIIGGVVLLGGALLLMKKKPRKNRYKLGKKSNPKRKKRKSKKRKVRRNK